MRSNGVRLLSIWDLCIPRNGQDTFVSSLVRSHGHHDYDHLCHHGLHGYSARSTSAHHSFAISRHSFVLLFYDHDIMTLMILMTHMLPFYSPTLPGPSLDPHSFDYSSLSRYCFVWLSPIHTLCHQFIFIFWWRLFGVIYSHGHSSIYRLIITVCSSLAFESQEILSPLLALYSVAATARTFSE